MEKRGYLEQKEKLLKYFRSKKGLNVNRAYRQRIKETVLTHYGNGYCACVLCGFGDLRALSIDHMDGRGAEHRRRVANGGGAFYNWLIKNEFPEGYQTLCMNCQWIKKAREGENPRSN